MKEKWKFIYIDGVKTSYKISNLGKVKSVIRNKIRKPTISAGYYRLPIIVGNKHKNESVHRLVAEAFIPNLNEEKNQVNHKDGNKLNNVYTNLEWVTASENPKHAYDHLLRKNKCGDDSHLSKYNEDSIKQVCELLSKGFPPLIISEETGVGEKLVYLIRSKKVRKDLVSKYKFPKLKGNYSKKNSFKLRDNIEKMIRNRCNNAEIYKTLNLKTSKNNQDLIYRIKKQVIGEGSTTIENKIYVILK